MITQCSACQTAFRVTETQLAARGGQVRCGACANVFDAMAHLLEMMPPQEPKPAFETPARDVHRLNAWPEPEGATTPADTPPASVDTVQPVPIAVPAHIPDATPLRATLTSATPTEFSFGPTAKKPMHQMAWTATVALLALLLAAQGLFYFRSDIALLAPETKPLLKDACTLLGCTIPLPQRSDLMTIEASDLQADGVNPNVVILTANLRNRAAFAQAHPALELTLTDTQDLPLARRVLLAADYLDSPPNNESGFAAGAERAIRVTLQLADIKATGYRLYLFYP